MSVLELSSYTSVSKYSRYVARDKRRESWEEAVGRNEQMMLDRFPHLGGEVRRAYDFVRDKKVLPSMRAMQFGGAPMLKHNARGFNCVSSYCDRLRFFQECFYLLLCGCGTGFSVQEHHIASLPRLSAKRRAGVTLPRKVFKVPDCIEGWADAEGALLSSYHEEPVRGFEEWHDCEVEFDPSAVRPRGAPLSCGIGRAPGPDPLMRALGLGRGVLGRACGLGMERLSPLFAYDLAMHFADASVAGGVRRSATICIFSPWDREMASCKTGDWARTNPQRARSNNSAALLRHSLKWGEFRGLFEHTRQCGEPGFWLCDDYDIIPNPCCEIAFLPSLRTSLTSPLLDDYQGPKTPAGEGFVKASGWQACNLSTINGRTTRSKEDFFRRCEAASAIGTFQASFADFPYLGRVSEEIVRKEALLGVAICGMMHRPELLLDEEVQREGAGVVLATNGRLAGPCGVNPAARATCIKPDGKSSAVLMSEPGIRPGHSRRYFRVVQANTNERPYQHFRSVNPEACEPSVWSATGQDDCVRFCVENPPGTVLIKDLTAVQMLEHVRLTYLNWIAAGKRPDLCTHPGLSNNVSNTVTVRPHEWDGVARHIYENREYFGGVSLAPDSCDRDYPQAPYTAVHTPEEQRLEYGGGAVAAAGPLLGLLGGAGFRDLWDASDLALGLWPASQAPTAAQSAWLGALGRYAGEWHGGDVRRATYCLKDNLNWSTWERLKAAYRNVDYGGMFEGEMTTDLQGEAACQGGQCLVL